nr:hypothetical protein [Tanacetum cinerariifolium]
MVNTHTDTDLSTAIQNALQAMLPWIREEIREEFPYKQAKGGDTWLVTVTWVDFKKLCFLQFFPQAEQERLKREYHSIPAGTEEEQAKNFQWSLRKSTLNHLMCMSYTDVAQVANSAR